MSISVFDLFRLGIGPSSSHTVGPMRAARRFAMGLRDSGKLAHTAAVITVLQGSLGATSRGHGTDMAVILGLCGDFPDEVVPENMRERVEEIRRRSLLPVPGDHPIRLVDWVRFPVSNAMQLVQSRQLPQREWHSMATGFIASRLTKLSKRCSKPGAT